MREIPQLYYCRTSVSADELEARVGFLKTILEPNLDIVDKVLETHGSLSGSELIELVHQKGSPWRTCYVRGRRGYPYPTT